MTYRSTASGFGTSGGFSLWIEHRSIPSSELPLVPLDRGQQEEKHQDEEPTYKLESSHQREMTVGNARHDALSLGFSRGRGGSGWP